MIGPYYPPGIGPFHPTNVGPSFPALTTLDKHLALVSNFLLNGKETESGQVEELLIEDFNVFSKNDVACLCFIAKYKSCPRPYVRTTMYIEKIEDEWKVLHVHCSFEPER